MTTPEPLKIVVASQNPAKLASVESAFTQVFKAPCQITGIAVDSGVSDQPMSDQETLLGARNRVANARQDVSDADFWVGLEAGVDNTHTFAWMVVENQQLRGESRSASVPLPKSILDQLHSNLELGTVMDKVFDTENIKQKGGAIGLLTGHQLTRSSVYHQALILALIPFINSDLFLTE